LDPRPLLPSTFDGEHPNPHSFPTRRSSDLMSDLAFLAETLIARYFEVCSDYRVKREVRNVRRFRYEGPSAGRARPANRLQSRNCALLREGRAAARAAAHDRRLSSLRRQS